MVTRLTAVAALWLLLGSCTNVGLYGVGDGPAPPDRAELRGRVCVPTAAGEAFPVKVLYALQGPGLANRDTVGQVAEGVSEATASFASDSTSFALVAFNTIATGLQGSFARDQRVAEAIARYGSYNEVGPVSLRAPIRLAESILTGDVLTGCRGQVARTRYLVVMVIFSADTSCANPDYNPGVLRRCLDSQPASQCSACELDRVIQEMRAAAISNGAGEVTVQPIYVRETPDNDARFVAAAIARAGGSELIETDPTNVKAVIKNLNYGSLQRELKLKKLLAMNRNMVSRGGRVLVDSDGDGLSDEQEAALGTSPVLRDSDGDLISDGVEVRMGLKPQQVPGDLNRDLFTGCQPEVDTDEDRLNDCEERVLGTDGCIADTDGDGLPDLSEVLGVTNPLIPEDLADDDRDGATNVREAELHTDALTADISLQQERGYGYFIRDAPPTPDGRACYDLTIYNVTLGDTLQKNDPDGSGLVIPRGMNDVYLYFQVGRDNDPRGSGIGRLSVQQIQFIPPNRRIPPGVVPLTDDDFVTGL